VNHGPLIGGEHARRVHAVAAHVGEEVPVGFAVFMPPFAEPDDLVGIAVHIGRVLVGTGLHGIGGGQLVPLLAGHLTAAAPGAAGYVNENSLSVGHGLPS